MKPKLRQGDFAHTRSDEVVGFLINRIQKRKATDDESKYNHSLLITNNKGDTFEALNKIDHYNLDRYKGQRIVIYRYKKMTPELYKKGWDAIKQFDGKGYPYWRLFMHLSGLAKFIHWDRPVCSELVSKFMYACDLRKNWWGVNPDDLADCMDIHRDYVKVFEGIWE